MKVSFLQSRSERDVLTAKPLDRAAELAGQKFESMFLGRILKSQRLDADEPALLDSDAVRHAQDMHVNFLADEMSKRKNQSIAKNLAQDLNRR